MAKPEFNVDMVDDVLSRVTFTFTITGMKEFRIRLWLARQFLKMVCFILKTKIEVVTE